MSLPDIDYELSKNMGQFEYAVALAKPSTPEEMEMVTAAFKAGQLKERERIEQALLAEAADRDSIQIAVFKLRNIIYDK